MEWRYYGITLAGLKKSGPNSLEKWLQALRGRIQAHRWTQQLPAIRSGLFQKTTAFVFLAHLEDPQDPPMDIPAPVIEVFRECRYFGDIIRPSHRHGGHTLEEIKKLTRGDLTTNTIGNLEGLFKKLAIAPPLPLDLSELEEEAAGIPTNPDLALRHEHLLFWLSAWGDGTWERFVRGCVSLGLAGQDERARLRSLIRKLILLGHVQVSLDQQRWSVCPLALVTSETEPDTVFACGQQTGAVRRDLERQLRPAEFKSQPDDDGPPRLGFKASPEEAAAVTNAGGIPVRFVGHTASALVDALPLYRGWLATLPKDGSLRTGGISGCLRYNGENFLEPATPYEKNGHALGEEGLYKLEPHDGGTLYRYLDTDQGVWRTGDFHALRYAGWVAVQGRSLVGLLPSGSQVAVPFAQRWPLLHERCLVLAGGLLPRWSAADKVMTYSGVGRDLLTRLAQKLPFDLQEAEHA